MKILHVIAGLEVGGAEISLCKLVLSHVASPRFRHSVVSLTTTGELGRRLEDAGVDVTATGMRSPWHVPRALWRLRRMILELRPDIVQTWMYHADLLGGLAAKSAGSPNVIWGVRSTDMMRGTRRSTFLLQRICALLSSRLPTRIVCAADASRRAHASVGYDSARMIVIPNGYDTSPRRENDQLRAKIRAEMGFTGDVMLVGCIGRFNQYKDQRNFVAAAGLLARRFDDVRFVMAGAGIDSGNRELMGWIANTGFADRFTLVGLLADVQPCLSSLDVFCLPSRSEGFPNVVGEAMAAAVPCVVTDVGDAAVLVADTGVVVPPGDSHALANGLAQMLSMTTEQRRDAGRRAQERVAAEFSADGTRRKFEALYLALAAGREPK
jgi:glycosyltransferase involved in cell wall biosynthesis